MGDLVALESNHLTLDQSQYNIVRYHFLVSFIKNVLEKSNLVCIVETLERLGLLSFHSVVFCPCSELFEQTFGFFDGRGVCFLEKFEVLLKGLASRNHSHLLLDLPFPLVV